MESLNNFFKNFFFFQEPLSPLRTFSITAIGLWNKLPLSFRSASSINCLIKQLLFVKYLLYNCFRSHQSEFKQFTSFPDFKFK
jgi:hypothetical protein